MFQVSRNTAEILEKFFKNLENYFREFGELFHKIILKIISAMFENHFKKFRTFSRITISENIENISKKKVSKNVLKCYKIFFENVEKSLCKL